MASVNIQAKRALLRHSQISTDRKYSRSKVVEPIPLGETEAGLEVTLPAGREVLFQANLRFILKHAYSLLDSLLNKDLCLISLYTSPQPSSHSFTSVNLDPCVTMAMALPLLLIQGMCF